MKSLVMPRPQPDDPRYTITTETFINTASIGSDGRYRTAEFRQGAKDTTGYVMAYGRDKILRYYYDCAAGEVAGASDRVPGADEFMPFEQFRQERPKLPFADPAVVSMVC